MKTTYHTTGFLADEEYCSGLKLFLQQYKDRFPGLSYLHLALEEYTAGSDQEMFRYYDDGKCLNINVAKWNRAHIPPPFDVYTELRSVFDLAVEEHLKNHHEEFLISHYNEQ